MRTLCSDKNGVKKGTWTAEEDKKLVDYVTRYGHWNWRLLPKFAGLARCGKSCRLRWLNYLRPNLKRGNFTQQEEETIIRLRQHLGSSFGFTSRWSAIASQMPGRTDNEIKNHWRSKLKKLSQHKSPAQEAQVPNLKDQTPVEPIANNIGPFQSLPVPATTNVVDSCPSSDQYSSSSESSSINTQTQDTTVITSNEYLILEDEFAFLEYAHTFPNPISDDFWSETFPTSQVNPIECFSPDFDAQLWNHNP